MHLYRLSHFNKGQISAVERSFHASKERNENLQVKNFNTIQKNIAQKISPPTQQHNLPLNAALPIRIDRPGEHKRNVSCQLLQWKHFWLPRSEGTLPGNYGHACRVALGGTVTPEELLSSFSCLLLCCCEF